jgi:hypothetical protein
VAKPFCEVADSECARQAKADSGVARCCIPLQLTGAREIDEGVVERVYGSGHAHIELPPTGILEHGVGVRPLIPLTGPGFETTNRGDPVMQWPKLQCYNASMKNVVSSGNGGSKPWK